jgi:hypothetical protein
VRKGRSGSTFEARVIGSGEDVPSLREIQRMLRLDIEDTQAELNCHTGGNEECESNDERDVLRHGPAPIGEECLNDDEGEAGEVGPSVRRKRRFSSRREMERRKGRCTEPLRSVVSSATEDRSAR